MEGKEVHFSIDLGWLLNHYLTLEYERMTEKEENDNLKRLFIHPLWDFLTELTDAMLITSFETFVSSVLLWPEDKEVLVEPEMAKSWATWQMEEFMKTEEYKVKTIIASGSYVHDKKTGEYLPCGFGHHQTRIYELIDEVFGEWSHRDMKRFPEYDEYIRNNIEIKGANNGEESYMFVKDF